MKIRKFQKGITVRAEGMMANPGNTLQPSTLLGN